MTAPAAFDRIPAGFTGEAPLFPLPNVVHFPHVMLPLHIFEPRYRRMTADALAGDRLIAMALIRPEGAALAMDAGTRPPIFETVCLSRITLEQQLPDGRYYLLLEGLARARLRVEVHSPVPYRIGRLELCADRYPGQPVIDRDRRRRELLDGVSKLLSADVLEPLWASALDGDVPLGLLCDVLAHALQPDVLTAQRILDELDVDFRSELVYDEIRSALCRRKRLQDRLTFPPHFSRN